jgi:ribonuclease P/MRP protein subunit RPP1
MKRVFADLHLRLNVKDAAATLRMINKAAALGYGLVAAPLAPEARADEIAKLQAVCNEAGMDFASRIDLRPRTPNELMRQLRRMRRKFEVVCVNCENKAVARQAAKDRRVDLLSFPLLDFRRRFFDRSEAELARSSLAALEVDVKPLLVLEGPARVRLLSSLRREAAIAKDFHVPLVVSSGVAGELLLRKPREMAALAFLFGLDEVSALDAVSQSANAIVKRNREKLSAKFVAPGIRVVKEGKDC